MPSWTEFFQECHCVSLDRAGRWERFLDRWNGLPVGPIQRFAAIDGQQVPAPKFWSAGRGAWGCLASHRTILEQALSRGVRSLFLMEDDAVPAEGFCEKLQTFLEAVPADWGMIYLGGQHLQQERHPPRRVNAHVLRAWNVNRTHAFGMSRRGMEVVYQHLWSRDWQAKHHIDHHLGRLHEKQQLPVYCPVEWLIGQAEGHSNINGKDHPVQFWNGHLDRIAPAPPQHTVIAVLGPFRSGTSGTAGILHKLGVSMGDRFERPNRHNPHGFYEAVGLANLCRQLYREPALTATSTREDRVARLTQWLARRQSPGTVLGAKHPTLCLMLPEILQAWPGCRVVAVDRPAEESIASLIRCGWRGWTPQRCREAIEKLLRQREHDLQVLSPPLLRLEWGAVRRDPATAVDQLIAFAGLAPTAAQRQEAIRHVQ